MGVIAECTNLHIILYAQGVYGGECIGEPHSHREGERS